MCRAVFGQTPTESLRHLAPKAHASQPWITAGTCHRRGNADVKLLGGFRILLKLSWVNRSTQMARIECPKDTNHPPRPSGTQGGFRSYTGEVIIHLLFPAEVVRPASTSQRTYPQTKGTPVKLGKLHETDR